MSLALLLLLFSSGASSSFLPLQGTVQNRTEYALIDEMLCLLKAEKQPIKGEFSKPIHVKNPNCAYCNTKTFIHELEKIPTCKCMQRVEKDMERLRDNCSMLQKASSHDEKCKERATTNFFKFKESLEEFLRWVNHKQNCSNILRSEMDLYLDNKCSCPEAWKQSRGFF